MRGFFEIGIYHNKHEQNIGTLWRSAYQLGASGIFTIGARYRAQSSDTLRVWRRIPLRHYADFADFNDHRPHSTPLVAVEMGGREIDRFVHPERAIYLLGAEDHGLPREILGRCQYVISLPAVRQPCFNVAVAGSLVMFDRMRKGERCAERSNALRIWHQTR